MDELDDDFGLDEETQETPELSSDNLEFFRKAVVLNIDQVEDDMVGISAQLAYAGEQAGMAHLRYLDAKRRFEMTESGLTLEVRSTAGKITVAEVEAKVKAQPQYQSAYVELIEADAERQVINNQVRALYAKKDMLQIIGATRRREFETKV